MFISHNEEEKMKVSCVWISHSLKQGKLKAKPRKSTGLAVQLSANIRERWLEEACKIPGPQGVAWGLGSVSHSGRLHHEGAHGSTELGCSLSPGSPAARKAEKWTRVQPVLLLAAGRERKKTARMTGREGAKPPSWSHLMGINICKYL